MSEVHFILFLIIICLILIACSFFYVNVKVTKGIIIFISILFALFCATREIYKSADTVVYYRYFNSLNTSSLSEFFSINGYYNLGYEFLNKVVKVIFGEFRVLLFIICLINFFIIWKSIKNSNMNIFLALLIYIAYFGFYYNYIVLRQGIVISISIYILSNLKRVLWKNLLLIAIAFSFHEVALALVPMLFILRIKSNYKILSYFLITLSIIMYIFSISNYYLPILFNSKILKKFLGRFADYLILDNSKDISIMFIINMLITAFLIFLFYKVPNKKNSLPYLNLAIFSQLLLGLFGGMPILPRVIDIYNTSFIFLIPDILEQIKERSTRCVIATGIIFLSLLFYIRIIIATSNLGAIL